MKILIIILILIGSFQTIFAQKVLNVPLGIINGRAIDLPRPEYPEEAKKFCASGKVEVETTISRDGDVIEAKAILGDNLIRNSSVDAVKRAKFLPIEHSNAAKLTGIIVYNFDSFNKCLNLEIVNKKALNLPKPPFPAHLKINKTNIVAVKIITNESGNVIYANAILGHPILQTICENAARYAKFYPTYITPGIKVPALLIYKFRTDRTIDTDITSDNKDVAVTPINRAEPFPTFCNCKFDDNPKVTLVAEIDERGNVFKATAVSGHPLLKAASENAALRSTFVPVNIRSKAIIIYYFEEFIDKGSVKFLEAEIKNVKDIKVQK